MCDSCNSSVPSLDHKALFDYNNYSVLGSLRDPEKQVGAFLCSIQKEKLNCAAFQQFRNSRHVKELVPKPARSEGANALYSLAVDATGRICQTGTASAGAKGSHVRPAPRQKMHGTVVTWPELGPIWGQLRPKLLKLGDMAGPIRNP